MATVKRERSFSETSACVGNLNTMGRSNLFPLENPALLDLVDVLKTEHYRTGISIWCSSQRDDCLSRNQGCNSRFNFSMKFGFNMFGIYLNDKCVAH